MHQNVRLEAHGSRRLTPRKEEGKGGTAASQRAVPRLANSQRRLQHSLALNYAKLRCAAGGASNTPVRSHRSAREKVSYLLAVFGTELTPWWNSWFDTSR